MVVKETNDVKAFLRDFMFVVSPIILKNRVVLSNDSDGVGMGDP